VVDGTLWQITPISIVRRDINTGAATAVIDPPNETWNVQFAFGSIWTTRFALSLLNDVIDRVSPINGKVIATIDPHTGVEGTAISRRAIWLLTNEGKLLEIDPDTNALIDHGTVPHEVRLQGIAAVGDKLWICECGAGRLIEFDPAVDKVSRTVKFTQSGFVIPDDRVSSQGAAVTSEQDVMWLLDGSGGTITPVDAKTGEAGSALGIPRPVSANAFGFGALWLAADGKLSRVDMDSGRLRTIEMPVGLIAGGVALDEQAGVVWVSTCVPALANFADSPDPCRSDNEGG
jgi:hypothetical protein